MMKAFCIHNMSAPLEERLQMADVPEPSIQAGEALVHMKAAALNHRDEWIRRGQYAKITSGVILGSDGCGVVERVGSEEHQHWIGKEVILNPSLHWGDNPRAQHPKHYAILGLPVNGTFAEYVGIGVGQLFEKPAHLSAEQAAALPLAGLTAYRAVFTQSGVQSGHKVLVTGIGGGVAQFAAQFAVAAGATVWVSSGSEEKLARAKRELGVYGGVLYTSTGWEKDLVSRAGEFDVIIDSAGGESVNALLMVLAFGGVFTFFGATNGRPPELNWQAIFWRQLRIQGTTMGNDTEFAQMLRFVNEKKIVPVVDSVRSFADITSAFTMMSQASQFGKLVVKF